MENNFWANLAPKIHRWISEGTAAEVEEIQCPICQQSNLGFPGFSPPPRPSTTDTAATENPTTARPQESTLILPCGHIIGANCGREWFQHCAQQARPLTCPLCRCNFRSNRCAQHRSQDGFITTNGGGEGEESTNEFAELSTAVDQFLQNFIRKMEAARSCTLCATHTAEEPEDMTEPMISITMPGNPPIRYSFPMDRFIGSDDEFSGRFAQHLRGFDLEHVASQWEEYRDTQQS